MRILYIHQYFCTRAGRSGTRSYEFSKHLVRQGHRVTMLTSVSDLSDLKLPPRRLVGRFRVEGIDVIALRVGYSQNLGVLGRICSFLHFMFLSSWVACGEKNHNVIIATSTPLTVGVPGLLASFVRRIPLVFEVRDLWPEAPIQMGVIRNRVVQSVLRAFERLVYRRSTRIIALSPGMRDGVLAAGTPATKVSVIPNCSDLDLFRPGAPDESLLEKYDLQGSFVVAYAGSMGDANGVDTLMEAATQLEENCAAGVKLLLIGQGKKAAQVRRMVEERPLRNVVLAGSVPRQEVASLLRASQVCLVLFKNLPVLATNSPNKLFDALATGRPVIVNSNGWTRDLVERHHVGLYAEPDSGTSLAAQILWLKHNPAARAEMGRNARHLAEVEFDRLKRAVEFERVLLGATVPVGRGPARSMRVDGPRTGRGDRPAAVRDDRVLEAIPEHEEKPSVPRKATQEPSPETPERSLVLQ